MKLSEAQALFDSGFAERFRYVLQQHERAVLARMRQLRGEAGAETEANMHEMNLAGALFEVSRFIDDRIAGRTNTLGDPKE